ncbi:MAG: polymer-forming cytoskeletal protein [Proteobacteria bacterium]|nr:polymer-forming cytoskeletal protein [Pseudomonadota bacterium]MBU1451882.1 polymer-forming cytoskeletal protein [Pseudomonadota bacterium]MBU2470137.1 polymer-forming cytoskeletal protein [Pseudomonadota bacterium]MBU2515967.1 polymer-forming cytoskeletal protein [Pseudomonadota bacterium]
MSANQLTILAAGTIVRGDLFSQDLLVVEGGVQGNVVANKVVIKGTGWVQGTLTCRDLSIELGGVVDGQVNVTQKDDLLMAARAQTAALDNGGQKALPGGED